MRSRTLNLEAHGCAELASKKINNTLVENSGWERWLKDGGRKEDNQQQFQQGHMIGLGQVPAGSRNDILSTDQDHQLPAPLKTVISTYTVVFIYTVLSHCQCMGSFSLIVIIHLRWSRDLRTIICKIPCKIYQIMHGISDALTSLAIICPNMPYFNVDVQSEFWVFDLRLYGLSLHYLGLLIWEDIT